MTSAIVGTFTKIPKKTSSHSFGWARTWSENLNTELDHSNSAHDIVYLLHGANFGGSLNLFGGFTDDLKASVDNLMKSDKIYSLDIPMPDYGAMLKKRKDVTDKEWCDALSEKLSHSETLISSDLPFDWITVGDSHTAAYSQLDSAVVKQDGTTLFGQVKTDFEYIRSHIKPHHKGVTISLGNIDIRHHICRHPTYMMFDMLDKYIKFIRELEAKGLFVEVATPWPIEFEERRLPKTGQYKGTNFFGSQKERTSILNQWNQYMRKHEVNTVSYPCEWRDLDPQEYANNYMEKPQSVHLNPMFYRRKNWGKSTITTLNDFFGE